MKLFVYGTLKRGHGRAGLLRGQRFVGAARTRPTYRMYDCGSFPGLVPEDDGVPVAGEVWEVDAACLVTLDDVEEVAEGLYRRGTVELEPPFETQRVETYFYRRSTVGLADCGSCWE